MIEEEAEHAAPGEVRTALAPPEAAGERVDAWLATLWPDLSRSRVQGLIGAGKLTVDGALVAAAKDKTRAGATYALQLPPPEPAAPLPEAIPLDIGSGRPQPRSVPARSGSRGWAGCTAS